MARYVSPFALPSALTAPGNIAALSSCPLAPALLCGSSGSVLAQQSQQGPGSTCFITRFIWAEEDCAASAVTLTDVCTSQAEWTCCSYILTEVSHKKIKIIGKSQ